MVLAYTQHASMTTTASRTYVPYNALIFVNLAATLRLTAGIKRNSIE